MFVHVVNHPIGWLEGRPITVIMGLVYGYIPYMILPLYGFLDRIDASPAGVGTRPGRQPRQHVLARDAAPVQAGHPGRE